MKENIQISPCGRVIEIKEIISIKELSAALGKSQANTLQFVNNNCKGFQKLGRALRIPPQTITLPIKSRKREAAKDFYEFSDAKDSLNITKPCFVSDIAKIFGVTYLAAQKWLKRNNVAFEKNKQGYLVVPIVQNLQLNWYQLKKIA